MRIDRATFLSLTAAIAYNAQPPATPGGIMEIPTTAPVALADPPDSGIALADASGPPLTFKANPAPSAEALSDPPNACTQANATGAPADCTKIRRPSAPH